jgi:cytochrome c oxidase cbb3-type subunit III
MNPNKPEQEPGEDPIRAHVFDGWLMTLYAGIVFSIIYWMATQHFARSNDETRLAAEMQRIEAEKLASSNAALDADTLWRMSRNPLFVDAGRATYQSTCASCHGSALTGGIGPSLTDAVWLHGGAPGEVLKTVNEGVLTKGMPAWGPVLGGKKISEVVAFILSNHATPGS